MKSSRLLVLHLSGAFEMLDWLSASRDFSCSLIDTSDGNEAFLFLACTSRAVLAFLTCLF